MLVITRKPGQELVIPECDLIITFLENRGAKLRVGISGSDARVYRRELWERMLREDPSVAMRPDEPAH